MQVGATIGQYRLLRKIGEGGMGVVFVGEHVLIRRKAAIKVLRPEISQNRGSLKRFFNEARATAAIQAPGIAQLFDVGLTRNKSAYIAMELLDGESLDVRLERVGRLAPPAALRIVRQVAATLEVVHAKGIIHRDLKPANLFHITDTTAPGGERIKILDFGVAKLGDDLHDGAQTAAGSILGTPRYMSPEQCSGTDIDPRADIYSLGCVLFRLLTGRPPFVAQGVGPIIAAHLTEPPPPPSRVVPALPAGVDELVLRCLAKSRADRFPTMVELGAECDRLLAALSGEADTSIPALPEASTVLLEPPTTLGAALGENRRPVAPRRRWIGAGLAAICVIAGVTVIAVTRNGGARSAAPALSPPAVRAEAALPPIDAAAPGVAAIDAAAMATERPAPPAIPATPPPPAAKPAVVKPAAKPRPRPGTSVPHDELYENRN